MSAERIKSAKEVREEIIRKYNKNPAGWHVLVGRDSENYMNSLFLHEKNFWIIKEFPLNPYKFVGFGTKSKLERRGQKRHHEIIEDNNLLSFGLRPLNPKEEKGILSGNFSIVRELLKRKPSSLEECSSSDSLVMEGPILTYKKEIFISEAQKKLDKKLKTNLRKLIYERYPELMRSYV
jgi:hypothetical protein